VIVTGFNGVSDGACTPKSSPPPSRQAPGSAHTPLQREHRYKPVERMAPESSRAITWRQLAAPHLRHMLDALQRVVGVEQRDTEVLAALAQVGGLQRLLRIGDDMDSRRVRRHDVTDDGHVLPRHRHAPVLLVELRHRVGVDDIALKGPGVHRINRQ